MMMGFRKPHIVQDITSIYVIHGRLKGKHYQTQILCQIIDRRFEGRTHARDAVAVANFNE